MRVFGIRPFWLPRVFAADGYRRVVRAVLVAVLLLLPVGPVFAQAGEIPTPQSESEKSINASKMVSPLRSNVFGEDISLYDGSTTFSVTDVDIPGNNSLPVRIGRRLKIEDRHYEAYLPGFSDWDIDLPRIEGVFLSAKGWVIPGSSPNARCSIPSAPDVTQSGLIINSFDIWHGNYLYIPGVGQQEMLVNNATKLPAITDGQTYPWVTAKFWRIRCLPTTASGYPGEAFVALSPDGTKYTLDYVVARSTIGVRVGALNSETGTGVARDRVSFLVTRVDDRFGNWVKYAYSNGNLTGITSSDGRSITLGYANNLISTVTANGKTWNYSYTPIANPTKYGMTSTLSEVDLPDESKWTYSYVGTLLPLKEWDAHDAGGSHPSLCPVEYDSRYDDDGYHLTITSPSGAVGKFDFGYSSIYRSHTPVTPCQASPNQAPSPYASHYSSNYRIGKKTISGVGLTTQSWTYYIDDGSISFYTNPSEKPTDPCPACRQTKTATVIGSDGKYDRYMFGIVYGNNEGQLLRQEHGTGSATPLSYTLTQYLTNAEVAAQNFPDAVGGSLNGAYSPATHLRPVVKTTLYQDGKAFQSEIGKSGAVYSLDAFARPNQQIKSSFTSLPPVAPSGTSTVSVPASSTTGNYTVSWTTVAGATSYKLEQQIYTDSWIQVLSSSGTSAAMSNMDTGTYGYRITACNDYGCGPTSGADTINVLQPTPRTPTIFPQGSWGNTEVKTVKWSEVGLDVGGYYILDQSADGGSTWGTHYTTSQSSTIVTQPSNTTYRYRVKACYQNNTCGAYSPSVAITVEFDPCPTCRGVGGDFRFEPMRQVVANAH